MKSLGKRAGGLRLERMRASRLWAGEAFRNVHPVLPGLRNAAAKLPSLSDFLCSNGRRVPPGRLPSVDPIDTWRRPAGTGLRATWLGHSTVLIEIDGLRVLTDPVWGMRASPSRLAGPKRFQPVPVPLRALPPLDLVLVSHDHYDHLDYPTIRELARHRGSGAAVPCLPAWPGTSLRPCSDRGGCVPRSGPASARATPRQAMRRTRVR
jgi:hypothetical protein